jgi:hypothetical protein
MDGHASCGNKYHLRQEHEQPGDRHKDVREIKGASGSGTVRVEGFSSDGPNAVTFTRMTNIVKIT